MVDGNIPPLNAADDKKSRMFLWNNIFFSLGFDMKEHYGEFGGDAAAYAAIVSVKHWDVWKSTDCTVFTCRCTLYACYRRTAVHLQ